MSTPEERLRLHARARMFGSRTAGSDNGSLSSEAQSRNESLPTQAWRERNAENRRKIMASLNGPVTTDENTSGDRNGSATHSNTPSDLDTRDTQVARGRTLSRQYAQIRADGELSRYPDESVRSDRTVTPESYAADVRNSRSRDPFRANSHNRTSTSELESGVEDLRRREWLERLGGLNPFTTHTMHPST